MVGKSHTVQNLNLSLKRTCPHIIIGHGRSWHKDTWNIDTKLVRPMTISARSLCSRPYLPIWEIKSFIDNASRFFHFLCFFLTISVMYSLSEGRGFTFGASVTSGTTIKMRRIWAQKLFTKHNASWINLQANNLIHKNFIRMEYEEYR